MYELETSLTENARSILELFGNDVVVDVKSPLTRSYRLTSADALGKCDAVGASHEQPFSQG
jgi:hypothetical protein